MAQIQLLEDENSKYAAKFNAFQQISTESGKRLDTIEARETLYRSKIEELANVIEKMREFKDTHVKEENTLKIGKFSHYIPSRCKVS
jgi:hypothetical protein